VLSAVVLAAVALPGAAAVFSDKTLTPSVTIPMARFWSCPEAGGSTGANAARYYRLQEGWGTTATNTSSAGTAANGTFSSTGVTYGVAGPTCGPSDGKAVQLDGTAGAIWTRDLVSNPQTFSVQVWFSTRTTRGGKLIGFGSAANGGSSVQYDRHVYMTNTGQLVFGVYSGGMYTVASPGTYNNGVWHLATATFSAGTGMKLYVDGGLVASSTSAPGAEVFDGYWRIGYDNVSTWPSAPTSNWFAGSLAQASIYSTVLGATQVSEAWEVAR
jgi:hypothetical protein